MAYPDDFSNLPDVDDGDPITADHENAQAAAINAIEETLGLDPAASYETVGEALAGKLDTAGGTMSGDIAMGTHKVSGLGDASALTDAANARVVQKGAINYAADSGAADAYAVTLSPAPASYTAGMVVRIAAAHTNTGASTIDVNSLGTKAIKKQGATALQAGDIVSGQVVELVYDGTNFQMVGTSQVSPTYAGGTSIATVGTITTGTWNGSAVDVSHGGTSATSAGSARSNLGAAASGANSDITALSGLSTALSVGQGGTGATTASGARSNLSAAASGSNSDITGLSAVTSLSMNSNAISSVSDPTNAQDAATKNYIDVRLAGKSSVRLATAAALASYSFSSNVLTATANGALSIDGLSVAANDRILVKNESGGNLKYNGLYTVSATGDASHPWSLTRSPDMNASGQVQGAYVYVKFGGANFGTLWGVNTTGAFTINTTGVSWLQLGGVPQGNFSANSYALTSLAQPSQAQDAATKSYVDNMVPVGACIPYFGLSPGLGSIPFLHANGQLVSRSTYSALYGVLTFTMTGNISNGSTTISSLSPATGLVPITSTCGVVAVEGAGIPNGTQITAKTSTTITLSQAATATTTGVTIRIFPFGQGDGSTTFGVPDLRGRSLFGADAMGGASGANRLTAAYTTADGLDGTVVGNTGGAEAHLLLTNEMPQHTHSDSHSHDFYTSDITGSHVHHTEGIAGYTGATPAVDSTSNYILPASGYLGDEGDDDHHNNIPPGIVCNWIIRY